MKNGEKEININLLAENLLQSVLGYYYRPKHISEREKEVSKYLDLFTNKLRKLLNSKQKELFDTILEMEADLGSNEQIYDILYEMRVQFALRELIQNSFLIKVRSLEKHMI